jgi:hypothetical protein
MSIDVRAARFSGLQGPNSTDSFPLKQLPPSLKPEGNPLETGLSLIIPSIDKPAVKRLAFNLTQAA